MIRKKIRIGLSFIFIFGFYLVGCDTVKDTFNIGYENKDVQYSINGDQITHNADNESNYTSSTSETKILTWSCGNYKGQIKKYVSLIFSKKQGVWSLTSEHTSNPINCR